MLRNRLHLGSVLLLLAAACSQAPVAIAPTPSSMAPPASPLATPAPTGPTPACVVTGPWTVELSVTGGFAGVDRGLVLDQTGAFEARDNRHGRVVDDTAPNDVLAEVIERLPEVCVPAAASRPPACADCFIYGLHVDLGGASYEFVLNDMSLAQSPAGPLVMTLSDFLSSVLQG